MRFSNPFRNPRWSSNKLRDRNFDSRSESHFRIFAREYVFFRYPDHAGFETVTIYPLLGGSLWVMSGPVIVDSGLILGPCDESLSVPHCAVAVLDPYEVHSDRPSLGLLEGRPVAEIDPVWSPPTVEDISSGYRPRYRVAMTTDAA